MPINLQQLAINVNLHALRPGFLNSELHYVIASDGHHFRFATWSDEPLPGEQKFYCFLTNEPLTVPAGNVTLKDSYVLKEEPAYPVVAEASDFCTMIASLPGKGVGKAVRRFRTEEIDGLRQEIEKTCGPVDRHVVKSPEGEHLLLSTKNVDISISASMVYFRYKPF